MTLASARRLALESIDDPAQPGDRLDDAGRRGRDQARVERFRAGDRAAFDELVRDYQAALIALCRRQVGNPADATELAQKTFVAAFGGLASFRGDASVRTWLYRIALNLCANHRRDRRREVIGPIAEADGGAVEAVGVSRVVAAERAARLHAAVAGLAPVQRLVVELRVYDELSFKEVAALARTSENAAKVSFHQAIKRLRQRVAADGDEP